MIFKLYLITFNKYDNKERTIVSSPDGNKLNTNPRGEFLVTEENMKNLENYGGGIKTRTFIGLFDPAINNNKENYVVINDKPVSSQGFFM